ncbi:integrase-like protein [Bosea sp. 124]|nr:integrase-like protein [Bosea sp. 124]
MQSFFTLLKAERVRGRVRWTRDAPMADMFDYIEQFYNTIRSHSMLGYISLVVFAKKAESAQLAATDPGARH